MLIYKWLGSILDFYLLSNKKKREESSCHYFYWWINTFSTSVIIHSRVVSVSVCNLPRAINNTIHLPVSVL